MSLLLAIDPSTTRCGMALFRDAVLECVFDVKWTGSTKVDRADRCRQLARRCVDILTCKQITTLVTEWPQIYTTEKAKGDPNDLPGIAAIGTAVAAILNPPVVKHVLPATWSAQIPKEDEDGKLLVGKVKTCVRAQRIKERLRPEELLVWDSIRTYDELDAVGIGLWYLNRGIDRPIRALRGAV